MGLGLSVWSLCLTSSAMYEGFFVLHSTAFLSGLERSHNTLFWSSLFTNAPCLAR